MAGGHSHRSTLKNDHKPFKSKHATKGQLKNQYKGKVEKAAAGSNKATRVLSKLERKNTAKQLKDKKILDTKLVRKLFEGSNAAEKIITVISLTQDVSAAGILTQLITSTNDDELAAQVDFVAPSVTSLKLDKFKCTTRFILPEPTNLIAILDAAKVSDYVIFGLSAEEEVDKEYGEQILRAVIAQGIATAVGVVSNLVSAYPKKNFQADVKQSLESFFSHFFPTEEKLYAIENKSEALNCLRFISQKFPKSVNWRDSRGYLVASDVSWHASDANDAGYIVVEGVARGTGFNANRLVHINGHGDFQLERIEKVAKHKNDQLQTFAPTEEQESLDDLNPEEVDMDNDFDELDYDVHGTGIRMEGKNYFNDGDTGSARRYKAPKGTSEYQNKWLLDDVLEGASDLDDDDDDELDAAMMDQDVDEEMDVEQGTAATEYEPTEAGDFQSEHFMDLSPEEEEEQLRQFRKLENEDREFPDEIELDPKELAREKLREYRGIKSLGTCDWDWDEQDSQRPSLYSRLLRISSYKATKNKLQKDAVKEAQVVIGTRVRLYIRAPKYILDDVLISEKPFIIYSLLPHEHKLSVTNFSFKTWEDYEKPLPSGEALVVQYGFRRQVISPTFSQGSNNANNVHKFQRFAHFGDTCVATAIAPALFYNAPAIFFKQKADGLLELVGQGTFLNCDHTRVMAERVVLTGHAVKIHKRLITVRYMFFNSEDIEWFKAVPLFTKSGRTGFIKESLGTHGYFKSTFDGRLSAQDVIGMALYRRVWPGPSYLWNQ
ncbi:DUF663-domain-containing protein [Metschnikowia bicuspidata var. bicuspidata NRRL YB-4993]|uniref:DUF663-domain-containing protein n=1 Tax=Metschnikowia bicuspidata var. bicuspidata NRRL YB-4993 TaxID=869754 RepID=A0A1A0H7G1_9ASCO|nr:DUF663-domain-containing protein [Metschnikowia bicuspidata var. bicuspidata NRRL YB-4993]OBA19915.1 DUF663-domain-containing protein [Metschnikowia bicuspidata var. bicuspidata NRRL YB-4993]